MRYRLKSDSTLTWEQAIIWLRGQPGRQELVRACYFDDPLIDAAERYYQSEEWKEVSRLLHQRFPCRVLDIGAGRGISSYAFAKEGCETIALEPDQSRLVGIAAVRDLADWTGLLIHTIQGHAESLSIKDNSIDIVYGRAILHHAQDLKRLCENAARVLKKGGIFMATREHVISRPQDLEKFLASHPLHALYGGENAYMLTEYEQAITSSGLKLLQVIGPYESIINYAPTSWEQHKENIASMLLRFIGEKATRFLVSFPSVMKLLSIYLSRKSNVPGRLYSFLAVKP